MNIFELAGLQLQKEGKDPNKNLSELLDRAVKIRHFLDEYPKITDKVLSNKVTKFDRYNWRKRYGIKI